MTAGPGSSSGLGGGRLKRINSGGITALRNGGNPLPLDYESTWARAVRTKSERVSDVLQASSSTDVLLGLMHGDTSKAQDDLLVAAESGDLKGVEKIVAATARGRGRAPGAATIHPDSKCGLNSFTPLHHACNRGHSDIVPVLLVAGASVHSKTESHETCLHLAAYSGSVESVENVLDYGANIDAQNQYGETPLFYAARRSHAKVVELLLRRGADRSVKDRFEEVAADQAGSDEVTLAFETPDAAQGPLVHLPRPAMFKVLQFLTVADLGSASCTCGRWRRVIDAESSRLYKRSSGASNRWEMALSSTLGFQPPVMARFRPPSKKKARPRSRPDSTRRDSGGEGIALADSMRRSVSLKNVLG